MWPWQYTPSGKNAWQLFDLKPFSKKHALLAVLMPWKCSSSKILLYLQVDMAWRRGDVEGAQQASRDALKWNIIATITGVVLSTVTISIVLVLVIRAG